MRLKPHAGLAVLAVGGMEACWLLAGLRILGARIESGPWPPALLLAGLPLAFGLRRLAAAAVPRRARPAFGLAAGLAWVLFAGLQWGSAERIAEVLSALTRWADGPNPVQAAMSAAAVVWVCGLRLAGTPADFDRVLAEFQFGIVLLVLLFFGAGQWGLTLPEAGAVAIAFFAAFISGAAASRTREAGNGLPPGSRVPWLAVTAANAALIIGAGLLLAASVTPGILKVVLDALAQAWDFLAEGIAGLLALLARLLPQPEMPAHPPFSGRMGPVPEGTNMPELLRIPDAVRRVAAMLVAGFWIALFALSLWRVAAQIANWLRRLATADGDAEMHRLDGAFREDLRRLWRWLCGRGRDWGRTLLAGFIRGRGRPAAAAGRGAAVRRLYLQMLVLAASRGCRRRPHQTPAEFLERLCGWRPQAGEGFRSLSEHFVAARYGGIEPGPDTLEALYSAWEDVRRAMKSRTSGKEKDA
jgi:hypothetical protein